MRFHLEGVACLGPGRHRHLHTNRKLLHMLLGFALQPCLLLLFPTGDGLSPVRLLTLCFPGQLAWRLTFLVLCGDVARVLRDLSLLARITRNFEMR